MASVASISKSQRWFSNKSLRLSLPRLLSRSKSSTGPASSSASVNHVIISKEEELREVFRHFDSDGDGKISSDELSAYFASIGESISRDGAERVIKDFDVNGDNLLELKEFVRLMEGENEVDEDLRRAFEMYEVEKGSGCITPRGLQQMLRRLGDVKSLEECVGMIGAFDLDGNGVLDFHEFQRMMRGQPGQQ